MKILYQMKKKIYFICVLLLFSLNSIISFSQELDSILIDSTMTIVELKEVIVKSYRPYVKINNGRISFDLPAMIKGTSVANAFESLGRIPGLMIIGDNIQMIGANSGYTIILNGYKTNATNEQLITYLKSLPPSYIQRVELLYNAPPETGVKGTAINIIISQESTINETTSGMFSLGTSKEKYYSGGGTGALLINKKKWQLSNTLSFQYNHGRLSEKLESNHYLSNQDDIIKVNQEISTDGKSPVISGQLDYLYRFTDKNNLKFTGYFWRNKSNTNTLGNIIIGNNEAGSLIDNDLNDIQQYIQGGVEWRSPKYFDADINYKYYLSDRTNNINLSDFINNSRALREEQVNQEYRTISYRIARNNDKIGNWGINYGFSGFNTSAKIKQKTQYNDPSIFSEKNYTLYVGTTWVHSQQFSSSLSIASYYYQSSRSNNDDYSHFDILPTFSATYMPNKNNIFQISASSDRVYPSYDALSPIRFYRNAYNVYIGNSNLQPQNNYNISFQYIFKQRFVLGLYNNYQQNSIQSQPYQYPDSLISEIKYINFDYVNYSGINGYFPISIANKAKLTFNGSLNIKTDKMNDYHGISLKRSCFFVQGGINFDYQFPTKPYFLLNIVANGHTKAIQGLYDIKEQGQIGASVTYKFMKNKASLILGCPDIFNSSAPRTLIDYNKQYEKLNRNVFGDIIYLKFIYTFEGFKNNQDTPSTIRYTR
jgi:hypothetical protein